MVFTAYCGLSGAARVADVLVDSTELKKCVLVVLNYQLSLCVVYEGSVCYVLYIAMTHSHYRKIYIMESFQGLSLSDIRSSGIHFWKLYACNTLVN